MIEQELIEEIRQANDIVSVVSGYVRLKRSGSSLMGLCPFHNEKTPSFHVKQERQSFHCYGCGVGGNVLTFIMMIENYDFLTAVNFLADRANITIERAGGYEKAEAAQERKKKKETLLEIHKAAARFYYECLNAAEGAECAGYLKRRGLSKKTQIKCGLGFAPRNGINGETLYARLKSAGYDDDMMIAAGLVSPAKTGVGFKDKFYERLMFPIFDVTGNVVGFGGRTLSDGIPKYLNSPETDIFQKGRLLYGLNFARKAKKREIIIVEGYMDAIAMYQAGFANAVASLGTAFTQNHARLIKNYADLAIMLYDSDEAGVKAVYRAIPELVGAGLEVKVAQTGRDAKDPDEYLKKYGAEGLSSLLSSAKSHIAFRIDNERNRFDLDRIDGRVGFTKEAAKILSGVESSVERDAYIKETARTAGISEEAIRKDAESAEGYDGYIPTTRRRSARGTVSDPKELKRITEAQKGLLGIIANNSEAFYKSREYIDETVFTNETYKELYKLISELYVQSKPVRAEEIASFPRFETKEMQIEAFNIVSAYERFAVTPEAEREFTHQIKTVLTYKYEREKAEYIEKNDGNALQAALNKQKTLNHLNISLADG